MRALAASAKTTRLIELKLEIDSEKERKTKPRHETHIMGLQTSKYTSISLWEGLLTWGMAPKLTKGSSAKNNRFRAGPFT